MKTKPSRLSHVDFPFKANRNRFLRITICFSLVLLLFTSTLYAITPRPSPTPHQPSLSDTINKDSVIAQFILKPNATLSPYGDDTVTGNATDVTANSATLNGTVNARGNSVTASFQYGITSGSYGNSSSTQSISSSSITTVSIGISGLSSGTMYYYRASA